MPDRTKEGIQVYVALRGKKVALYETSEKVFL